MMRPILSRRQDSNLRGLSPLGYKASLFNHSSTPAFFSCSVFQRTFSFAVHSGIEPEPLVRQTNILAFGPMDYKKTLPRISCRLGGLLTILFLFLPSTILFTMQTRRIPPILFNWIGRANKFGCMFLQ